MSVSGRRRDGKSGGGGCDRIDFEERESHRKHNFYQDKESNGGRDKKREWNQDKERHQSLKIEKEHAREKERCSDRQRDYRRRRNTNNERVKSNLDERDYFYGRDNKRQKYDHEKDRQYKHRPRSRSEDRCSKQTKSPSPPKRNLIFWDVICNCKNTGTLSILSVHQRDPSGKRASGFDMAPSIASGLTETTATGNIAPHIPRCYQKACLH